MKYLKISFPIMAVWLCSLAISHPSVSFALEMKVYCFGDNNEISAPFPIEPTYLNGKMKETYLALDILDLNNYQFYYDPYKYSINIAEDYLTRIAQARTNALGATVHTSKYTNLPNGGQLVYSYRYRQEGREVHSITIAIINGNDYFSWAVQSYPGFSSFDSEEIFNSYRKYVGKNTGYCK